MNNKTYLVKKDPSLPNAKDNWIIMDATEFYHFMQTEEGKARGRNFGRMLGEMPGVDDVYVECGHEVAAEMDRDNKRIIRNELYLTEEGINTVSLNDTVGGDSGDDECCLEEYVADLAQDVFNKAMLEIDKKRLKAALLLLRKKDVQLINELFLNKNPLSEREYGAKYKLSKSTVHSQKEAVLERLKTIFEEI